jgi:hypothetical protein
MAEIKISNFGKQNTPPLIQKIGDALLLAGTVGIAIVTLPATVPAIVLPVAVVQAGGWLAGLGVIGKTLSKFFGGKTDEEKETE